MQNTHEITPELLSCFSAGFHADEKNAIRQHAVVKAGIGDAAENHQANIDNPMVFSIELKDTGKITNQKASGRCWLFAALNTMRYEVIHNLNLDDFELSQNYQMFWDKLEKANYFLESIVKTAGEPLDGRLVNFIIGAPMQDGGQWDMYAALADKYGCVPKCVMPETFHSSNTRVMNRLLTFKLREDADELRAAVRDGAKTAQLDALKERMLQEVYNVLVICLGEPPAKFDFEYRDKDGEFHRDAGLTPKSFFKKYIRLNLGDYVSVINAPTADKPYGKTFTVAFLGNVVGGREVKYLNLPSADLKKIAIRQLKDGKPVWFGCDVGQMSTRDTGLLALNAFDYEAATGLKFAFDKAQRLDYCMSGMSHAMVFQGVNLVDGKPNRWKVENSWSDKAGQKGYFIMSDDWFDEYNYQVVVNKKYLTAAQRKAFQQAPIVLKPWDPMGSLA